MYHNHLSKQPKIKIQKFVSWKWRITKIPSRNEVFPRYLLRVSYQLKQFPTLNETLLFRYMSWNGGLRGRFITRHHYYHRARPVPQSHWYHCWRPGLLRLLQTRAPSRCDCRHPAAPTRTNPFVTIHKARRHGRSWIIEPVTNLSLTKVVHDISIQIRVYILSMFWIFPSDTCRIKTNSAFVHVNKSKVQGRFKRMASK